MCKLKAYLMHAEKSMKYGNKMVAVSSEKYELYISKQSVRTIQEHTAMLRVCLFDLIIYVPSTIFQLNRDGSPTNSQAICNYTQLIHILAISSCHIHNIQVTKV